MYHNCAGDNLQLAVKFMTVSVAHLTPMCQFSYASLKNEKKLVSD